MIYADDLNAYRVFDKDVSNDHIRHEMNMCQKELHLWGEANKVSCNASKESMHILARNDPYGDGFRTLGVDFDTKLLMHEVVRSTTVEAT